MRRLLNITGSLLGLLILGMFVVALAWSFTGRGRESRLATDAFQSPVETPTPTSLPPQATPTSPQGTPIPPRATPTPPRATPTFPRPRVPEIALTFVPPEVSDALTQPVQITRRPAPRGELAVDGNYVVWRSYEDGQTNIVAYNLTTGEERRISSLPGGKSSLRIFGNYVVWAETLDQLDQYKRVVHVYDLVANREMAVGSTTLAQDYPDISGNLVVWNESRNLQDAWQIDIYGYDLQRGEEFPVVVGPGRHLFPRISGDWVIYLDWPPGASLGGRSPSQPTLRAHHLRTSEDIELGQASYHNDAFSYKFHVISGHRVVWRGPDWRAYLYDLNTRQVRILVEPQMFNRLDLHGSLLSAGSRVFNVETGAMLELFQPFRMDRPSRLDDIATDGQTVAWVFDLGDEGRVYVARFHRLP